ncbi:30S ribosomal protein S3 [Candidatus Woesearchaeota archaeon]|uniref:30S ribosomal protein S3 n=1 Tax=uncultured organism TaxID=155900 RepID=U3GQL3_9ZZZZ|nr:30S ribosomal protein S3 [uncultured organism]MBS3156017.1 30S ribosomal protein S3 [Candidatus Woesearchaeota archaeon]
MIEKQILKKKIKEYLLQDHIAGELPKGSYSKLELKKTPLGEKIIIYTSRPGLVVGSKGANINRLNKILKTKFEMENPEIEIAEIENPNLDPKSVAERIVSSFERFGPKRFKSLGYRALQDVINAGAIGAEIVISGRGVPSSRAKTWRFLAGHLKKSGDVSENLIKRGLSVARLKSGSVGVKVNILTPDIKLPDDIKFIERPVEVKEIKKEKIEEEKVKEKKKTKKAVKKKKAKENEKTPDKTNEQ